MSATPTRHANHIGRVATDLFTTHENRPFDDLPAGTLTRHRTRTVLASTQSADVVVVHHHDDLARNDGITALLRF